MIRGEPLTAVIPVRGGSKGLPRKNLFRLNGETLLERAIRFAKASPWIEQTYVTTDDAEMHAIASEHLVAMPALRPQELAGDDARSADAVAHLIDTVPVQAGFVLLLQVTTPLRTLQDLDGLCRAFEDAPDAAGAVSICRHLEPHPYKLLSITDGYVEPFLGDDPGAPRQSLPAVWACNGAFYLVHRDIVLRERRMIPSQCIGYEMPAERSVNLDGPNDVLLLRALGEHVETESGRPLTDR